MDAADKLADSGRRRSTSICSTVMPYEPWHVKWLVLFSFCYNTACNSFMYMDFATAPDVARDVFGTTVTSENGTTTIEQLSSTELNWLYSASLFAVLPVSFPCMHYLTRYNYATVLAGVVANVAGGWLRYVAAETGNYAVAMTSSLLIGCSSAVIITTVALIPEQRFRRSLRTLATTIGVQSNYAGWGVGTVLIPYSISEPSEMKEMLLIQAIVVSGSLVVFFLCYSAPPPAEPRHSHQPEAESFPAQFARAMRLLSGNKQFLLQLACFSILGGISFSITAVQSEVFEDLFSTRQGAWTNFAFVMSGVTGGLFFGSFPNTRANLIITTCFVACTLALSTLCVLVYFRDSIENTVLYVLCLVLMSVSGMSSLGFTGHAISKACRTAEPVGHSWSGGAVEWWIQVFGAVLALVSVGEVRFWAIAACAWVSASVMVLAYLHESRADRLRDLLEDRDEEEEEVDAPGETGPLLPTDK